MNTVISPPAVPQRRRLLAAVAATAGLAGTGLAWWHHQPGPVLADAEEALWRLRLDSPTGSPLEMQAFRGRPVLLNFWATWCPPCVEELPLIDRFFKDHAANGWQVVGLAVDQLPAVQGFLQKTPVSFPVGMAGLGGTELGRSLGNLTGGLPFTVVLGASGAVLHRKMGKLSAADLQVWAALK
ncbi:Thiol-disulfide isomerase or thioredoxin [Rhodoferax sp. OV413]|uniref:TlpA disulfide reductase family protein n=1 Tax=Rhodoferax sp. OV413 TaxID=1855285 RepID=UPI0008826896|nr:TlpA disulfide reductase family protein [Rhodoferax sp. OV413]SDP93781.1 Thiol-disulfide isomerase or thioredoxin [Rhodoferax sp. OV413]